MGAFAPCGAGAHPCAGASFAEVEIILTAATLLHDFDLALDPPDYQLQTTLNPAPAPNDEFKMRVEGKRAG